MQALAAEPRRVLITGANGHLGRRLIRRLAAIEGDAYRVRAVVRSERAARILRDERGSNRLEVVVIDYRDDPKLAAAAAGCEVAVHLVGIIKESRTSRYEDAHEGSCEALVRAAASARLRRIVYLSILGSDPNSRNACLASKGRAERILLSAATPALILRVPMVLGPGDPASKALFAQARARFVPLLRAGLAREQPIDADDVVSAILAGIERPDLDDVALDLAGPESLPRRELLARTAALHGTRPVMVPIPLGIVLLLAHLLEVFLSDPPLSRAMIGVLDHDDDIRVEEACARLGIELTPLDETLRRCAGPQERSA